MYNQIKSFLKSVLPASTLFRYEPVFRLIIYQFYRGKKYQCTICDKHLGRFIVQNDGERLCPFCGSPSRARRLWSIVNSGLLKEGITMLDFSPSRSLYRAFRKLRGLHYSGSDLSGDFLSDFRFDITQIDAPEKSFDIIICYHVLEHIENDIQAMKELYRVLKNPGTCIIQTPFKEGDTYENAAIKTKEERLIHFGQEDHVRIYSVKDLKERLTQCGFEVSVKHFTEPIDNRFGFKPQEDILVCTK